MVAGVLRFILFVLVAYFVFLALRIFSGLRRIKRPPEAQTAPKAGGVMVKDEVCGMYIPRDEALTDVHDGVERYFCSEDCRRKASAR